MQDLSLVEQSATILNVEEVMMVAAAAENGEVGGVAGGGGILGEVVAGADDGVGAIEDVGAGAGISAIGQAQHPVMEENFGIVSPETLIVPA